MLKILIFVVSALSLATPALAQGYGYPPSPYGQQQGYGGGGLGYGTGTNPQSHYVTPHTTQNGQFVPGHMQTNPNHTQLDNYNTRGNVNPYTGSTGHRNPYR